MGKSRIPRGTFYTNMAILSAVLVSESLSATLMMPFVGLFVSHLQHIPPSEAGYMSGLLISVFQLGQVLTGKMWGTASDRVGRKPMIQMGLLANAVVSIFFGMSPNLTFCVIMRFIHGCANGNVLVAKTVIADITDKETEGMGFAAISIFWGVGSIVGPAIGGYLYDPVHHAVLGPWLFPDVTEDTENLFFDHPALLPCLVISVFSVVTLGVISSILPETSRHPVDPFLSLFKAPTLSLATKNRRHAEVETSHGHGAARGAATSTTAVGTSSMSKDGLVAVVEEEEEHAEDDYDSNYDSAYDDVCGNGSGGGGAGEGRRTTSNTSGHPQLTKRLFSASTALPSSEGLNKVLASALLVKEYDHRRGHQDRDGDARHAVVKGRRMSGLASRSSSVGRHAEPRRRKADDSTQVQLSVFDNSEKQGRFASDDATTDRAAMLDNGGDILRTPLKVVADSDDDEEPSSPRSAPMAFGYREAFHLPSSRNVMIMYMCIASTESALLEIIPLWAISEREKGGLGFASADIGTLLCISSVVYVAVNVVFSRVLKSLGGATRSLWDFSVLLWCVTSILTPCCAYMESDTNIFYTASLITSVREIGLSWSYSILYMYVVRCAPDDCAGSINGIAQSIGSFSRMLTMLFIPPIFAWSLNGVTHPFPLNFHFVFWVTCLPLLLSFVLSSYLPIRVTG